MFSMFLNINAQSFPYLIAMGPKLNGGESNPMLSNDPTLGSEAFKYCSMANLAAWDCSSLLLVHLKGQLLLWQSKLGVKVESSACHAATVTAPW